ncbi:MAG TPA: hypothetical protein VM869_35715 [Enhygromyxa sp.]|nr:hypothetical protein [Enhygromyxa sp.]
MASPVTIEQTTGPKRVMIFKGRALPYRPLELGRTQRVVTNWLPGNPVATQQVLGPTFEPTTIRGMWKDSKLIDNNDGNGVDLLNFPPLSPGAALPQSGVASGSSFVGTNSFPSRQPAKLARVVVDALSLIVAEGQQIRFSWDQYVRFGMITRFVPAFDTIHDAAFEIEFTWSGDTDSPPIKRKINLNVLSIAAGLGAILKAILAALAKLANLKQPNKFLSKISNALAAIVALVEGIVGAIRGVAAFAAAPGNLLDSIKSALWQIKMLVGDLLADLGVSRSAAGEAAIVGEADAIAIAAAVQAELRERLVELASFAAQQQRIADLFAGDELLASFVAQGLTSLYDVASKFYGSPHQWTKISDYNAFYSPTVPSGTLVMVPK